MRKLSNNLHASHTLYVNYRGQARRRNYEFSISKEFFDIMIRQNCYYCDGRPSNKTLGLYYNGIDRIDNNKGYTTDNIVPCCKTCNFAKNKSTITQFDNWKRQFIIKNLVDYLKVKLDNTTNSVVESNNTVEIKGE